MTPVNASKLVPTANNGMVTCNTTIIWQSASCIRAKVTALRIRIPCLCCFAVVYIKRHTAHLLLEKESSRLWKNGVGGDIQRKIRPGCAWAREASVTGPPTTVCNVSSRQIALTTASVAVAVSQSVQSGAPAEAARTGGSRARVRMPRPTSPQSECRSWRQRP